MWPIIFHLEISACASCCAPDATDHLKPFVDFLTLRSPQVTTFSGFFSLEVVQNLQFDFRSMHLFKLPLFQEIGALPLRSTVKCGNISFLTTMAYLHDVKHA